MLHSCCGNVFDFLFFGIFVTNTCLRSQNSMYKMCHSVGVIGFHPGEPGFAFPVSLTFV